MKAFLFLYTIVSTLIAQICTVDASRSNVYYKATTAFMLVNTNTITGVNTKLEGHLEVGKKNYQGIVKVRADGFNSQNSMRDVDVRDILRATLFPTISFKVHQKVEQVKPPHLIKGVLEVNGVEKPLALAVLETRKEKVLILSAKTTVSYRDFNMRPPAVGWIITRAEENIEIGGRIFCVFKP